MDKEKLRKTIKELIKEQYSFIAEGVDIDYKTKTVSVNLTRKLLHAKAPEL